MARGFRQLVCATTLVGLVGACGPDATSYTGTMVDVSEAQRASHYSVLITVEGSEVQDMPGIGSDQVVVRTDLESMRCRNSEGPRELGDLRRGGSITFSWDGSEVDTSAPPQIDASGFVTVDC